MREPIIFRVELEGIKHALHMHLSEHTEGISALMLAALERELQPDLIAAQVQREVASVVTQAIRESVQNAITSGVGAVIYDQVQTAASTAAIRTLERMTSSK